MAAYDVVLFDADGTLMDFHRAEEFALERAFSVHGLQFDPALHIETYRAENERIWAEFERGEIDAHELASERFERFFRSVGLVADSGMFGATYVEYLGQGSYLIPGALDTVRTLAAACRMSVVTNGLARVQHSRFARSELGEFFDRIVISDEVGSRKPEPGIFDIAMALYPDVPHDRVLMVGDGLGSDILGGNRYGLDTCWYNPDRAPLPDGEARPTFDIRHLDELPALLHRA